MGRRFRVCYFDIGDQKSGLSDEMVSSVILVLLPNR